MPGANHERRGRACARRARGVDPTPPSVRRRARRDRATRRGSSTPRSRRGQVLAPGLGDPRSRERAAAANVREDPERAAAANVREDPERAAAANVREDPERGPSGPTLPWSLGSHPPCAATPPRVHPCGGAPLPPSLGGGMSYRRPAPPLSPRNVQSSVSRTASTSETNGGGGPVPDLYPTTHASTYASHSCRDGGVLDTTPS